jgi:flagellar FliJ protein
MAFHFSLGSVLQVRGILEEQEERMLQKIQAEIVQATEAIERIDSDIAGSAESRRNDVFKPFLGRNLHASYGEMQELKQIRKDIEERIKKLEELRLRQIKIYESARRDREMLTDMKEVKRSEYDTDMARSQQKTLDDNYIARRGRI